MKNVKKKKKYKKKIVTHPGGFLTPITNDKWRPLSA